MSSSWKAPTATAPTKAARTAANACKRSANTPSGTRAALLIPAFSIGRTQELLYELEEIIHRNRRRRRRPRRELGRPRHRRRFPLAADFTAGYAQLKQHWDSEARRKLAAGRHPLAFEQLTTVDDHATHLGAVDYLTRTARPAIVIAASGMCSGGRIVNYLKAMLADPRHDVLFVGYQAAGTPGRAIQTYGPQGRLRGPGRPAHRPSAPASTPSAATPPTPTRKDLLNFIGRMRHKPKQIRLVHGDEDAKQTLATALRQRHPQIEVLVPAR
jgi:metallo-beta-lactamase family protein